jgi:hypothetical protein
MDINDERATIDFNEQNIGAETVRSPYHDRACMVYPFVRRFYITDQWSFVSQLNGLSAKTQGF